MLLFPCHMLHVCSCTCLGIDVRGLLDIVNWPGMVWRPSTASAPTLCLIFSPLGSGGSRNMPLEAGEERLSCCATGLHLRRQPT